MALAYIPNVPADTRVATPLEYRRGAVLVSDLHSQIFVWALVQAHEQLVRLVVSSSDPNGQSFHHDDATAARIALDKFRGLSKGWDGRGGVPPAGRVLIEIEAVLKLTCALGLKYDRIVAIPDGGLAVYFFGKDLTEAGTHRLMARLALDNDESVTLLLEDLDNPGGRSLTDEDLQSDAQRVVERIRSHISR